MRLQCRPQAPLVGTLSAPEKSPLQSLLKPGYTWPGVRTPELLALAPRALVSGRFSCPRSLVHDKDPFQPIAALAAFAFPGAGHWYLGHNARAARICAGVLFLFLTGLLVGGISCVDRRENGIWFLGQALNGPIAFATDFAHTKFFKVIEPLPAGAIAQPIVRPPRPTEYRDPATARPVPISTDSSGASWAILPGGQRISPAYPPYVRGVGRMNELGTLFITIAGFMNLICIIDAAFSRRRDVANARGVIGTL